ncbi:hypothetical protein DXG01_009920 [Tephrocybe rancida]|nr:hypothetical protein DXG01_009920 [Tephrocybe rancida]
MFAREGCSGITLGYLEEEHEDAMGAKASIEEAGARVNLVPGHLMSEETCKSLVENHIQAFGKLDILVNNASKQVVCKKFADIDLGNVESTFRSNILQMFAVTKFAVPYMKRGSSIVNTTSVTAYRGSAGLAAQFVSQGIRVNAVAPGVVMSALQAGSRGADEMEGLGVGLPLRGRAGQSAEIGPAYVF